MRKPITIDELNLVAESVLKPFEEVNADPVFWMNRNTFKRIRDALKPDSTSSDRVMLYGYTLRVDDRYPNGVIETGASRRKRLELTSFSGVTIAPATLTIKNVRVSEALK